MSLERLAIDALPAGPGEVIGGALPVIIALIVVAVIAVVIIRRRKK